MQTNNHEEEDHNHNVGIFGQKTEIILSAICGLFLGVGFLIQNVFPQIPGWISILLYIFSYIFGGYYTFIEAYTAISKGKFEIDFLMLVAAIGAAALGQWPEGALLLFLFSLGHALEHMAMNKAQKSIEAWAGLSEKTAIGRRNGIKE